MAARNGDGAGWALAGLVTYVATVAITIGRNVPLNEALERGEGVPSELRTRFERPWTRWNLARTATNVASTACWIAALAHL